MLFKIPTLKYRRITGDMIELYKIFAGKYDNNTTVSNQSAAVTLS